MELLYLHYHPSGKPARYILLLYLGSRNGKYAGIVTDRISDGERNRVTQQAARLAGLSLERKIEWLKAHCPVAVRNGYREVKETNSTVVSRHPIGRI